MPQSVTNYKHPSLSFSPLPPSLLKFLRHLSVYRCSTVIFSAYFLQLQQPIATSVLPRTLRKNGLQLRAKNRNNQAGYHLQGNNSSYGLSTVVYKIDCSFYRLLDKIVLVDTLRGTCHSLQPHRLNREPNGEPLFGFWPRRMRRWSQTLFASLQTHWCTFPKVANQ